MRLLVLGGSGFVGRMVAEEAVARGCSVTAFARGTAEPPEGVELVRGDRRRTEDLRALGERDFDAVVDTWAAEPAPVRDAARRLVDRAGLYVYMSSISVYERHGS